MSYTPNEWKKGDVVTSEKLNHMEQGIAESGGGGYDGKIQLTYDEHAQISGGLLESGTYDSILNALYTKKYANIIVYDQYEDEFGSMISSYSPISVSNQLMVGDPDENKSIVIDFFIYNGDSRASVVILPDNTVVV